MLLTKKTEYALLSLVSISKNTESKNVDVLSKELEISKSFLAKIMQNLARHGLVMSKRGINGGFILNKSLKEITILDIVEAAEDKTPAVFECSFSLKTCPNSGESQLCTILPFLDKLQNKVNDFLSTLTLKDIAK